MQYVQLAPSVGGWHELGESDYVGCLWATRGAAAAPVEAHPAWRAVSFVSGCNAGAFKALVSELRDPRWYIDPADPDSLDKYFAYLGLNPRVMDRLCRGILSGACALRCWLTLNCWGREFAQAQRLLPDDARGFLYRIYVHHGETSKAVLRASQKFAVFLRAVWLTSLTGRKLLPDRFFRPDEAEAFMTWMLL
jgi:hypothetical protein